MNLKLLLIFILPAVAYATCDCGSTNSTAPCTGQSVSYTSGASTISFSFQCAGGDCRCGKFANSWDYWVAPAVDGGRVDIIEMSPAATGVATEAEKSFRNGWAADTATTSGRDGMDG